MIDILTTHTIDSTNTTLLARVTTNKDACLVRPTLLLAKRQTAGRGRAGRRWICAENALTCSLAWPFLRSTTLHDIAGLSLVVGILLAETLAQWHIPVTLKWPNDVLYQEQKLGGTLIETASDAQKIWGIIGIGLNLGPPAGVPHAAWINLEHDLLLNTLLTHLIPGLQTFEQSGFVAFHKRWQTWHAWQGCEVCVVDEGRVMLQGVAQGIDTQGHLRIKTTTNLVTVASGDISLRRKK